MDIIIHNHYKYDDSAILARLADLADNDQKMLSKLDFIIKQNTQIIMLNQKQFDELIARLNTVTNDIAEDYKKLLAEIQAGNITDASVAEAKANIERLEALGASVSNPVPE